METNQHKSNRDDAGKSPIKTHFRLKRPCQNCPFKKKGAIELEPGRLKGIVEGLLKDDASSFPCHKTVHCSAGGEFDDEGNYIASGHEAMCAGAAAYLSKVGRPTIGMRIGFLTNEITPSDWDAVMDDIIDEI
jgi:hypothetical protein